MTSSVAYRKRWELDRAQGIDRSYVALGPVVDHITALVAAGMTRRGIALAAGVSWTTVSRCLSGHYEHMQRRAARKLLAVTVDQVRARPDESGRVPRVGAVRRIQALQAMGWTHAHITAQMAATGVQQRSNLLLSQQGTWCAAAVHRAVIVAYDRLSMTPGPSQATRKRALARKWAPPLAWDDSTIDDPTARPTRPRRSQTRRDLIDPVAVDRATAGEHIPLTEAERAQAIAITTTRGLSLEGAADLLQISSRTVLRHRQAAALEPTRRSA